MHLFIEEKQRIFFTMPPKKSTKMFDSVFTSKKVVYLQTF